MPKQTDYRYPDAAFVIGSQMHVILDDGSVWTLGRVDQLSQNPLEWQQLPPIPGTEAHEIEQRQAGRATLSIAPAQAAP